MAKNRIVLDQWQEDVLASSGNIALRSGRQSGKSTVISLKAADFALNHPNTTIMVISAVERQAYLLFEKILAYLMDYHKNKIKKGRFRPTRSKCQLTNGARIYCLPTGLDARGIRGYTIDMLIADEAAFINEPVWSALTPALATTKGQIILLSTPFGREGYFYRCFTDPTFKIFHVSSEDCPRISPAFLEQEKKRMTKLQYAQEYLGEFVDELRNYFPRELIKSCMTLERTSLPYCKEREKPEIFLGVDLARFGEDESVFLTIKRTGNDDLSQIDMDITTKTRLTDSIRLIKHLDRRHNFKIIYLDESGLGAGVLDVLLEDDQTRRKTIGINNAKRSIDAEKTPRKKRLMKEDLYSNLLKLMEQGKIKLFDEPEIFQSLASVQYEYTDKGNLKIFGRYTHIAEALVRAAWCTRDKALNIWIAFN